MIRLRIERMKRGMKQADVATFIEMSSTWYGQLERGTTTEVLPRNQGRLERLFQMPLCELLADVPEGEIKGKQRQRVKTRKNDGPIMAVAASM
jgi:transcriptional regulator with XRE-family HTH domain